MDSEQGGVSAAAPLFTTALSDPATIPSTTAIITQPESDSVRAKSLKRSRAEQSQGSGNLTSIANASLGASPSPKSPRFKGTFSPAFTPIHLTGAAALADDQRKREQAQKTQSDQPPAMSENPGHKALSSLMAGGGASMSKPQDAPVATTAMSEGLSMAANAIAIPSSIQFDEKPETSPASVTSLASLGSTAPTVTASSTVVASPAALTSAVEVEARAVRPGNVNQLQAVDEQSSNRALSFPGNVMGHLDASRGPPRGASLPMPGHNQQLAPRSPSQKKHKCPYCETEFTRHHNLKSHLLTHSQEKPYVCQTCTMRFRRLHDLKRHMKLHTGERPHICPKCDRKFARGDALARHSKGQGSCAGRRASTGSFGGDDEFEGSNAGDGNEWAMDGVIHTHGTPHPNENEICTGSPSQNSSMTDSTLSEDVTDWEKDSDVETCEQQLYRSTSHTHLIGETRYQSILFQSTLEPAKKRMVDQLMEEFWILFNQNWAADAKQCSPSSGSSTYTTNVSPGSTFRTGTHPGTNLLGSQGGGNANEQNPDKNPDNRRGEKGKQPESPSDENQTAPRFACPYRKRDPRKYCVRDWRSCALGPHKTVARVKAHLYKYHTIYQCQRCKRLFNSDDELDSHIMEVESCTAITAPHVDGITKKIKEKLQCKRKAYPGQTEAARWKQIYQILFPEDEEVPDPFFEPIRDNENSVPLSSDLTSLTNYEDFLRRVLPGLVRTALETQVSNQIQPIEEGLRGQIVQVIEQAQNRAFHDYRTMMDANHSTEPSTDSGYVSSPPISSPSRSRKEKERATGSLVESSMPSRADFDDGLNFPETFVGTDPVSDFRSLMDLPRGVSNIDPSTSYPPPDDVMLDGFLPFEGTDSSNVPLFSDQFWGSMSNAPDAEYYSREDERDAE